MPHSDRKNTTHAINNSGEQLLCQNTDADRCGEGEQRLWLRLYLPAAVAVAKADYFYYFSFRGTLTLKSFNEQSLDLLGSSQEDFPFVSSVRWSTFSSFFALPVSTIRPLSSLLDSPDFNLDHFQRHFCGQEPTGCKSLHQWTQHLPFPPSEKQPLRNEGDIVLLKSSLHHRLMITYKVFLYKQHPSPYFHCLLS